MSGPETGSKPDKLALPRDAFRSQRVAASGPAAAETRPLVVTPTYDDTGADGPRPSAGVRQQPREASAAPQRPPRMKAERNPFEAYGERSSSRPYALRLPDAVDLVLRQMAAEERTQPLRVIDRILYEHLRRIGRLPPI
ncbi:MAG TPA: hypothetical protein VGN91_07490 [Bosea sp. (in: a-proteobacteria)]|nr:hypothetical protein [Bosea sp. (in: a-proteobacteria)]